MLTKSPIYFWDAEAIKENGCEPERMRGDAIGTIQRRLADRLVDRVSSASVTRNKRSVWTVATAPYPEAHFATYPPDLIKPCILAGTSAKGCCAKCGAPWERMVERTKYEPPLVNNGERFVDASRGDKTRKLSGKDYNEQVSSKTIGWQPTCECDAEIAPCTVLDPFAGSGTSGAVALELGRKAVLIELNPKYIELIRQRCDVTPGLALA